MTQSKILIAAVAVAILGTIGYVAIQPGKTETVVNETPEQRASQPTGKKMAFSQFIKEGGTYKCIVHQSVSGTDTTGTTYLHQGMIRGEYSTSIQNMNIDATVIVRDGYAHSWTSIAPTMGFKSKVVTDEATGSLGTTGTYSYNTDQIGDYDCQPWTADVSLFELPTGITFKEV